MLFLIRALFSLLACSPSIRDIAVRLRDNAEYQNITIKVAAQPIFSKFI